MFAKLDAVHGYFQLGLDKESSKVTTFLLPQGKFRYLRAPMGLNASSDEWCYQSDVLIRGISWARKIVDDTLIWAEDMEQLTLCRGHTSFSMDAVNTTLLFPKRTWRWERKSTLQDILSWMKEHNQMKKNMQQ